MFWPVFWILSLLYKYSHPNSQELGSLYNVTKALYELAKHNTVHITSIAAHLRRRALGQGESRRTCKTGTSSTSFVKVPQAHIKALINQK